MLLEEFDKEKNAIINPQMIILKNDNMPKTAISCFSKKLIEEILDFFPCEEVGKIKSANGSQIIYSVEYKGKNIGLYMSMVGAAACVGSYEEVLAMGMERLVLFGTCGCLDKNISDCSVIVPSYALRDEGTSYHYMPQSDEIEVNSRKNINIFEAILNEHGYGFTEGKVWTTDGIYRETKEKMERRKKAGCIAVDMECSAMAAVSKFRNKEFFQFFYAADNLDGVSWDKRSLKCEKKLDEKMKIAVLALEMAYRLEKERAL